MFVLWTIELSFDKLADLERKYLEEPELPPFVKRPHSPLVCITTEREGKIYSLFEIEKGKEWDGLMAIAQRATH